MSYKDSERGVLYSSIYFVGARKIVERDEKLKREVSEGAIKMSRLQCWWTHICYDKRTTLATIVGIAIGIFFMTSLMYNFISGTGCQADVGVLGMVAMGATTLCAAVMGGVIIGTLFYGVSFVTELPRTVIEWRRKRKTPESIEYRRRMKEYYKSQGGFKASVIENTPFVLKWVGALLFLLVILPYSIARLFWLIFC